MTVTVVTWRKNQFATLQGKMFISLYQNSTQVELWKKITNNTVKSFFMDTRLLQTVLIVQTKSTYTAACSLKLHELTRKQVIQM